MLILVASIFDLLITYITYSKDLYFTLGWYFFKLTCCFYFIFKLHVKVIICIIRSFYMYNTKLFYVCFEKIAD